MDKLVSFDYNIARITVKLPVTGTGRLRKFIRAVVDFSKMAFDYSVTVKLTGLLAGINMDMPIMCCSAIIIGVAVDDTIHFFRRYSREFTNHGNGPEKSA